MEKREISIVLVMTLVFSLVIIVVLLLKTREAEMAQARQSEAAFRQEIKNMIDGLTKVDISYANSSQTLQAKLDALQKKVDAMQTAGGGGSAEWA